jgi:hypothetical protein
MPPPLRPRRRMPDLLDRIRAEMSTRLPELRPLVDEHIRLDAALQDPATPTAARPFPRRRQHDRALAGRRRRRQRATVRLAAPIVWLCFKPLRIDPAPRPQSWPQSPASRPTPCTRCSRAWSRAASCRRRRCRPAEPIRTRSRPAASGRGLSTRRRRPRVDRTTAHSLAVVPAKAILQYAVRPPRVPPSLRGQLLRVYRSRRIERSVWVVCAWIQRTKASAEMRLPAKEVCT